MVYGKKRYRAASNSNRTEINVNVVLNKGFTLSLVHPCLVNAHMGVVPMTTPSFNSFGYIVILLE